MEYDHFIRVVHHHAQVANREQAVTAIRAFLETLTARLTPDGARHLAAELPREIAYYVETALPGPERLTLDEFYTSVAVLENVPPAEARRHSRAVVSALREALSEGAFRHLCAQLPTAYAPLFAGDENPAYLA